MRTTDLHQFVDKTVRLSLSDGETATVRVLSVDDDEENLIAEVAETSRPEHGRAPCSVHTFAAEQILSVNLSG